MGAGNPEGLMGSKSDEGGPRLIHFLQLRRFLRSVDGSTNTGGSPTSFTRPHVL